MKGFGIVIAAALAVSCDGAAACSVVFPERFDVPDAQGASEPLESISVISSSFVPRMGDETSCEGFGSFRLELSLPASLKGQATSLGYTIKAISGVHEPDLLPSYPIVATDFRGSNPVLSWSWFRASPGVDGKYRWELEVTAVTRDGRRSVPVVVCLPGAGACQRCIC